MGNPFIIYKDGTDGRTLVCVLDICVFCLIFLAFVNFVAHYKEPNSVVLLMLFIAYLIFILYFSAPIFIISSLLPALGLLCYSLLSS